MEDRLVLNTGYIQLDPFATITRLWAIICQVDNFIEVKSNYNWYFGGSLPFVQFQGHIVCGDNILQFLKAAYDINYDLDSSLQRKAEMLEELCYSRLRPAINYALWVDNNSSKKFYTPHGNVLWQLINLPVFKLRFLREKGRIMSHLKFHHNISSDREALLQADQTHQYLSDILGNNYFFLSNKSNLERPRSTDIVVYSYLAQEVAYLNENQLYQNSLKNYPNLISFMERMESIVQLTRRLNLSPNNLSLYYVLPKKRAEEIFAFPKIQLSKELVNHKNFRHLILQTNQEEGKIVSHNRKRRIYVTTAALILFAFNAVRVS